MNNGWSDSSVDEPRIAVWDRRLDLVRLTLARRRWRFIGTTCSTC